ncbi:MAG: hypothetical protein NC548_33310 [Lachnospiraceae bacterium]|nr:hypothetical protein [Lachnospiraceae bacterium]
MEYVTGEVLNINNEYGSYQEYKAAVDTELQRSAEGFVRIGYLLKMARDTDILKESGYSGVNEFAEAEYSLDKSQVSRFIRINDEYSEGGYSDRLQDRYKNFGYAKLALMLMLPAAVNEELTADYTKSEIQAVKDEIDEENKRTDIEVMLEEKDGRQQEYGLFAKVLYQIGKEQPELYTALYGAVRNTVHDGTGTPVINKLAGILAPAGEAIISVRIAGEGKKLLSIKGSSADPVIVDIRTAEKTGCPWDDFIGEVENLCAGDDAEKSWELLYGEAFPEERAEVAPVQPEQKVKETPKKPQRVIRSKPEETEDREEHGADEQNRVQVKAETGQEEKDMQSDIENEPQAAGQEDVEGQLSIENYPQYMPRAAGKEPSQQYAFKGYMDALRDKLDKVYLLTERGEYDEAEKYLVAVSETIRKIEKVREEY